MRLDDHLVLSATDLSNHLACRHLTALDLSAAMGQVKRPVFNDEHLKDRYTRRAA